MDNPVAILRARSARLVDGDREALDEQLSSEAAAAMEAVSASPSDPGPWWEVVQDVQFLYRARAADSEHWKFDTVHQTTDQLILSMVTILVYVCNPDALPDAFRETFNERMPRSDVLDNLEFFVLPMLGELSERERVDALATSVLLGEFLLHYTVSTELRVLLMRSIANSRAWLAAFTGSKESLRIATSYLREVMELLPDDSPDKLETYEDLALPLWQLAEETHDLADVQEVIDICHHRQRSGTLDEVYIRILAQALALWTTLTNNPAYIDECIDLLQEVVENAVDEEERLETLFALGDALVSKFQCADDREALTAGVVIQQRTFRSKGSFGSGHEKMIRRLADTLHLAAIHLNNDIAVEEEISLRRGLADMSSRNDSVGTDALKLATALALQQNPEAVPWCVLALLSFPADQPDYDDVTRLLTRLTESPRGGHQKKRLKKISSTIEYLRVVGRAKRLGQELTTDDAVRLVQELPGFLAIDATYRLATLLMEQFSRTGEVEHVDAAIALFWAALRSTPPDFQPTMLDSLAHVHYRHYLESADPVQLRSAIAARRVCLYFMPAGPKRDEVMSRQTEALRARFDLTGVPPNQLEFGPDGGVFAMRQCGMLAGMSATKTRNFEMAWYALDLLQLVKAKEPEKFSTACQKLNATLYHLLSKDTHRTADLRLAILLYRELVEQQDSEGEADPDLLNGLGTALYEAASKSIPDGDFDESITLLRRALSADVPAELKSVISHNLANALKLSCGNRGDIALLDEAIELHHKSIELAGDDPMKPEFFQANLDDTLHRRSTRLGSSVDSDQAPDLLAATISWLEENQIEAVSALSHASHARRRLRHRWSNSTETDCIAVAESLFDTISTVMWQLSPGDRLETIGRMQDTASDAAAVFISVGMPEKAVEILEHGRNLQWSQMLRARTEITALHGYRPDLAEELSKILESNDTGFDISLPRLAHGPNSSSRWNDAVESTRSIPGFEHFLAARPYDVLQAAGDEGPVIIVNTSPLRCDALILDRGSLTVVELPIDHEDCNETIAKFVAAVDMLEFSGALDDEHWSKTNDAVRSVARWLWEGIVDPVLARLTLPDTGELPRLWWCPTGGLTFMPLHAAGDTGQTLLTKAVSSYTRSLWSLIEARAHRHDDPVRLLLVSVPENPGQPVLRAVEREIETVQERVPRSSTTLLSDSAATKDAVQAEMLSHTWLHFACHGGSPAIQIREGKHVRYSTDSDGLRLFDGNLDLQEIASHKLHHVELAIVTACKSSASDVGRFNEALHPAGALQTAGCQQIVASLWSVSDQVAPDFVATVYGRLTATWGKADARLGAHAVHEATVELRCAYPDDPLLWTFFIHSGI